MHQIVCRLGLHPRTRLGAYNAPQISWILGGLLLGAGRGGEVRGGALGLAAGARQEVCLIEYSRKCLSSTMANFLLLCVSLYCDFTCI